MNRIVIILFLIILSVFITGKSIAQGSVRIADSVKVKQKETGSSAKADDKDQDKVQNKNKDADQKTGSKGIKQVKGARPDMSKARGARPPEIERPSGSRIPRGVGKPGGAIKPGKL